MKAIATVSVAELDLEAEVMSFSLFGSASNQNQIWASVSSSGLMGFDNFLF
jgi:hypothetical protein